jgi:type IV secretory pathway protease TraF
MVGLAATALAALPARYAVDGCSMAPGLVPGDVVATGGFPVLDGCRLPRRFERWVVDLADGVGIKRVVALPGEAAALDAGDLVIAGATVLKSPRLLAALGSRVATADVVAGGHAWRRPAAEILDDMQIEPRRSRVLHKVRDVGVAAVVRVERSPDAAAGGVRMRVGRVAFGWRLTAPGRHAIVAGRLDGRAVAVAWPLPATGSAWPAGRGCLPPGAPERWQRAESWPDPVDDPRPLLEITVAAPAAGIALEAVRAWRDVHHLPAANGGDRWTLGPAECLVLGDFPAASTDSRHWGPLPTRALRHRIAND